MHANVYTVYVYVRMRELGETRFLMDGSMQLCWRARAVHERKKRDAVASLCMPTAGTQVLGTPRALAAASAVMLSTRRTVAAGVRMCTVPAEPMRMGPTVTPPLAVVFITL